MLKELLNLWQKETSLVEEMIEQFVQMLDKDKDLYQHVTDALFLGGDLKQLKDEVYTEDSKINKLEQLIRRKIVSALCTDQAQANITSSLILMSVTKDAERIGDYAKNIFEVFQKTSKLNPGPYYDRILDIRGKIVDNFERVKKVFKESNVDNAKVLLQDLDDTKKLCDKVVSDLMDDQKAENAVAYALLSRFFKRTLGHLANIVTSVIMPVDKLDYFDKDHAKELDSLTK